MSHTGELLTTLPSWMYQLLQPPLCQTTWRTPGSALVRATTSIKIRGRYARPASSTPADLAHALLDVLDVLVEDLRLDRNRPQAVLEQGLAAAEHVRDLALRVRDDGVVPRVRVGPVEEVEVRERLWRREA